MAATGRKIQKGNISRTIGMILVTVGLEMFPFDRLISRVDFLIGEKRIMEETIIQTGSSSYRPINCMWKTAFEYQIFIEKLRRARIVIMHAGAGSIILCARNNKIPIVVPRLKQFGEAVDNHQLEFVREVDKLNTVIPVYDIDSLEEYIEQYDEISMEKKEKRLNPGSLMNYLQGVLSQHSA
jgi:UDP-N-acetylglucosamine transferase subunit ALG13